jgi:hypothetical protein
MPGVGSQKMMIPPKPERFEILCHDVGLALLLGQKVQFALTYYFGVYQAVRVGWEKSQVDEKIRLFLSKPMGVIISEIKKQAPLPEELSNKVDKFKKDRDWLVHDFDEESTPYISRGEKIDDYISRMEQIVQDAQAIMFELDEVGDTLMIEKGIDPQDVKRSAEERRKR